MRSGFALEVLVPRSRPRHCCPSNCTSLVLSLQNLFFSDGTPQLSANEYYKRVSNGAIRLTGAVAGPYRMPFNLSYYANNDSGMSPQEPNARTLAQHAVEAVNADFSVGSLAGYDNNGDGYMVRDLLTLVLLVPVERLQVYSAPPPPLLRAAAGCVCYCTCWPWCRDPSGAGPIPEHLEPEVGAAKPRVPAKGWPSRLPFPDGARGQSSWSVCT